jgi:hypothetical protein
LSRHVHFIAALQHENECVPGLGQKLVGAQCADGITSDIVEGPAAIDPDLPTAHWLRRSLHLAEVVVGALNGAPRRCDSRALSHQPALDRSSALSEVKKLRVR